MPTATSYSVEVSCIQGKIMIFDFGKFAIIVENNMIDKKKIYIDIYFDNHYRKEFMNTWMPKMEQTDFVKITNLDFINIKSVASRCLERAEQADMETLYNLLRASFSMQTKGHKF